MPSRQTLATINCPKCSQTLPGWADKCQFCGHQLAKGYVRPTDAYRYKVDNRMTWQEVAYIIVSAIMLLNGVYTCLLAADVIPNVIYKIGGSGFLAIFGGVQVAFGAGLLFQQEWAQFIVKLLSWLAIAVTAAQVFVMMMWIGTVRGAAVAVLIQSLYLAYWCMVCYLISNVGDA